MHSKGGHVTRLHGRLEKNGKKHARHANGNAKAREETEHTRDGSRIGIEHIHSNYCGTQTNENEEGVQCLEMRLKASETMKTGRELLAKGSSKEVKDMIPEKTGDKSCACECNKSCLMDFGSQALIFWNTLPEYFAKHSVTGTQTLGVMLYFYILRSLFKIFLVLSVFALAIVSVYSIGNGVAKEHLDPFRLSRTTLANLHAFSAKEVLANFELVPSNLSSSTLNTSSFVGNVDMIDPYQASRAVFILDFIAVVFFMVAIFLLQRNIKRMIPEIEEKVITLSDYSIYVTNLPLDATRKQLKQHFEKIVELQAEEAKTLTWKRLRGGKDYGPFNKSLYNNSDTNNQNGTKQLKPEIVSKVTLLRENRWKWLQLGKFAKRLTRARLVAQRQKVLYCPDKLPNDATCFTKLIYRLKYRYAESRLRRIRDKTEEVLKQQQELDKIRGLGKLIGAFVTFYEQSSVQRVLDMYDSRYPNWHSRQLSFGKYTPYVHAAPEPQHIIWENIAKPSWVRRSSQCKWIFAMVSILVMGIFAVYQCNLAFRAALEDLPDTKLCDIDIPAKHVNSYRFMIDGEPKYVRNASMDHYCPDPSMIWISLGNVDVMDEIIVNDLVRDDVNGASCTSPCVFHPKYVHGKNQTTCYTMSVEEGCPSTLVPANRANLDPTCAKSQKRENETFVTGVHQDILDDPDALAILSKAIDSVHCCSAYPKDWTILSCYCSSKLKQAMSEQGFIAWLFPVWSTDDKDLCSVYIFNKRLSLLFMVAPAVIVPVINVLIRLVVQKSADLVYHESYTDRHQQVAALVLVGRFINTALMPLMLNGKFEETNDVIDGNDDRFVDFTRTWYTVVGHAIILSLFFNAFVPLDVFLLAFLRKIWRLARLCARNSTFGGGEEEEISLEFDASSSSTSFAKDPTTFNITYRYSLFLNTLLATLVYSAILPIIVPFACFYFFAAYTADAWALKHEKRHSPSLDHSFALLALELLPLAGFLHCGFAFWAYGNEDLMPSRKVVMWDFLGEKLSLTNQTTAFSDFENWAELESKQYDPLGIRFRLRQESAIPHLFLSLTILVIWILPKFFKFLHYTLMTIIRSFFWVILWGFELFLFIQKHSSRSCCCFCCGTKGGAKVHIRETTAEGELKNSTAPFLLQNPVCTSKTSSMRMPKRWKNCADGISVLVDMNSFDQEDMQVLKDLLLLSVTFEQEA